MQQKEDRAGNRSTDLLKMDFLVRVPTSRLLAFFRVVILSLPFLCGWAHGEWWIILDARETAFKSTRAGGTRWSRVATGSLQSYIQTHRHGDPLPLLDAI